MSSIERTTRYATTADELADAWAVVMTYLERVGPNPTIKISPFWSSDDDFSTRRFSVVVEGMQEVES